VTDINGYSWSDALDAIPLSSASQRFFAAAGTGGGVDDEMEDGGRMAPILPPVSMAGVARRAAPREGGFAAGHGDNDGTSSFAPIPTRASPPQRRSVALSAQGSTWTSATMPPSTVLAAGGEDGGVEEEGEEGGGGGGGEEVVVDDDAAGAASSSRQRRSVRFLGSDS
jgi:hypothetical protein